VRVSGRVDFMRGTEANRARPRPGRSWRVHDPVEQAGTMGERRAIRGDDRQTLDPVFRSGPKLRLQMRIC
jgi:hypothetical protein